MKHHQNKGINNNGKNNSNNGFTRNSFKFISSCIKTVSSGVRSASASVASSIFNDSNHLKEQVLWACFDRLDLGPSSFKRVLLLGYTNGFQVFDVDDGSTVNELVSKRDGPCTFLQIQPYPLHSEGCEGFKTSHPLLLVAAVDETKSQDPSQRRRDGLTESHVGNVVNSPTAVRFYSLRSHNYVHVLRFRSAVYTVRCSPRIVAVGLVSQIYCFDALTLENKFSVLTYPVPQMVGQGMVGINIGYGPMDVGPRWLAYASNNPLTNTGRLSPQNMTTSPGVSPSTSPGNGNLVARYAMESSKQLANGLINLGDMGYKTMSKVYQELLPDGPSSLVTSTSEWKVNKTSANSLETEIAGTVMVKDLISRAVIAHFRAHSSPISAICFDPSATLLVTASIHGNNINIFRILPSSSQSGSGSQSYNWTSSHVHLYKLHRGFTSAVIQDICFSQYSQWVAVISAKGTCHIYVLSPFGGEGGLQVQTSYADGPTLVPILSSPWWSPSSYTANQQSFTSPPPPVTLSVVSRIRTGNSGWLNTVSTAATSAAGISATSPSMVSAVFHCSIPNGVQSGRSNALEHILVYSPTGHLFQYELFPSIGADAGDTGSRMGSSPLGQIQDEDLKVKSEAIQCWDVCRRADWPEREGCVEEIAYGRKDHSNMVLENSDCGDNGNGEKGDVIEHSTLYLSKAEVQLSYGRMGTWQNSKVHLFAMNPVALGGDFGGEMDIEKVPHFEIEIKRKDLLPVFEHFQKVKPDWSNRATTGQKYPMFASEGLTGQNYPPATAIYPNPVQNPQEGSSFMTLAQNPTVKNGMKITSIYPSTILTQNSFKADNAIMMEISPPLVNNNNSPPPSKNTSVVVSTERASASASKEVQQSSNSTGTSEVSNVSSNRSDFSMNVVDEGSVQDPLDFGGFFEEEYCKAAPRDESHQEVSEVVTDVDSTSSPREKDKSEEDGDNDDMLGGVFDFSEEG